jgi:hypothetical protein
LDKLPDVANVLLGALGVGQFLTEQPFSLSFAVTGIIGWLTLFTLAFRLGREAPRD